MLKNDSELSKKIKEKINGVILDDVSLYNNTKNIINDQKSIVEKNMHNPLYIIKLSPKIVDNAYKKTMNNIDIIYNNYKKNLNEFNILNSNNLKLNRLKNLFNNEISGITKQMSYMIDPLDKNKYAENLKQKNVQFSKPNSIFKSGRPVFMIQDKKLAEIIINSVSGL